ncbi:F plasmid transfer operon protein TraF [Spirosoma oryzae]|uniref:F plasmid transfer operon protein TraF n=1 Tax=Spirosoma oryzae TaxID=1469603 RepID=A0A2T0TMZ4_9BACT|nr:conjugal transfer protein TraF [Spirosoma oryzae]PRY47082.1 F plasmid transfer operon protein TraF [Spirosoma oryzae]
MLHPNPSVSPNSDSAVLLVFHAPTATDETQHQQAQLTDRLQRSPGLTTRIIHIDASQHPAVVLSFGVTHFPTLILVQRGVELVRHEGTYSA